MYYIAYGSNLNLRQMAYRCPNSKPVGTGMVKDYQLVFNTHADIIPCCGSKVPVLLWDIAEEDWESLDRYEGYPHYYVKKEVKVQMGNKNTTGIAYVMSDDKKGFALPFQAYFEIILKGYRENSLDTDYLKEALDYSYHKEIET